MSETMNSSPAASFAINRRSSATAWQCLWGGSPSGKRMASERESCSFAMRRSAVWPRCTGSSVPPRMPIFLCSILLLYTIRARVKSGFMPVARHGRRFLGKNLSGREKNGQKDRPRGAARAGGAGAVSGFRLGVWKHLAGSGLRPVRPVALRKLLSPLAGRLPKREARRGRARAEVERWALLDKDAAEAEARALLEKAYPGQAAEAELLFLPRHRRGRRLT